MPRKGLRRDRNRCYCISNRSVRDPIRKVSIAGAGDRATAPNRRGHCPEVAHDWVDFDAASPFEPAEKPTGDLLRDRFSTDW
jgi:hypothetical protein